MNSTIGIIVGLIVAIAAGAAYYSTTTEKAAPMADSPESATRMDDVAKPMDATQQTTAAMDTDESDAVVKVMGSYEAYSPEKLARAETGDVVIFFHASWCPSCRGLEADIDKNLSAIPAGVSILKADYDTETELKKRYGVTYQHTLVHVRADGSMIKKWSGSPSLSSLISQIN